MAIEFLKCPNCKQRLALQPFVMTGGMVVCANVKCGTSLRVVQRRPLRVEAVPEAETHKVDYRPESYG